MPSLRRSARARPPRRGRPGARHWCGRGRRSRRRARGTPRPARARSRTARLLTSAAIGRFSASKSVEQPPGADPVAVVAPGVVEHVGLRPARRQLGAKALAEGEMLEVEREIDGEPLAAGPVVDRAGRAAARSRSGRGVAASWPKRSVGNRDGLRCGTCSIACCRPPLPASFCSSPALRASPTTPGISTKPTSPSPAWSKSPTIRPTS